MAKAGSGYILQAGDGRLSDSVNTGFILDMQRKLYRWSSGKEFAKHDWWLWWRLKAWLGKKHGGASGRKLRRRYTEPGVRGQGGWQSGGKKLARFADTKRLRYPDRGLRIPNGWN